MWSKTIILSLLILGAISQELDSDPYPEFKALESNEFGKSLIDALELHLKSNEPMQRFMEIMWQLESSIEEEQRDDDIKHRQSQQQCTKDLQDSETDKALQERRSVELQSLMDELSADKQKKSSTVEVKEKWLKELKEKSDQIDRARNQEKQNYEQAMNENEYVIYIVQKVKRIFDDDRNSFLQLKDQVFTSASQKQLSEISQNMGEAYDESRKFKEYTAFTSIFQVLNEVASRLGQDSESVKKLLEICDQLSRNAEDNMSLQRKVEDKRVDIYQKNRNALDKQINQSETEAAQVRAYLETLNSRIQSTQNDQADVKGRMDGKQRQIDDRSEECKMEAYYYAQNRGDRDRKRELVSQVIGLFSANQREFSDYVRKGRQ